MRDEKGKKAKHRVRKKKAHRIQDDVRKQTKHLAGQKKACRIALESEDDSRAWAAFEKVTNPELLSDLALHANLPAVRRGALHRLNDQGSLHGLFAFRLLRELARTERDFDVRLTTMRFLRELGFDRLPLYPHTPPCDTRKSVLNPGLEALCANDMLDPEDPDDLELIEYLYFVRGCAWTEEFIPKERRHDEVGGYLRMKALVEKEYDLDYLERYVQLGKDYALRAFSFCRLTGWEHWEARERYRMYTYGCERLPGYTVERMRELCETIRDYLGFVHPNQDWGPMSALNVLREGAYMVSEYLRLSECARYNRSISGMTRYVAQFAHEEAAAQGTEREEVEHWLLGVLRFAQMEVEEEELSIFNDIGKEVERCRHVLDDYDIDPKRLEPLLRGALLEKRDESDSTPLPTFLASAEGLARWPYDPLLPTELLKAGFKKPTEALRLALMRLGLIMTLEAGFGLGRKLPFRSRMFRGRYDLEEVVLSRVDLTGADSLRLLFDGCENLRSVVLSQVDTSHITDMCGMFHCCKALRSVDLSNLDTSCVTDFSELFGSCESLESIEFAGLDTAQATTMKGMFRWCKALRSVDLSPLDTSRVTDMSGMFGGCESMEELPDLTCVDTAQVDDMTFMFTHCSSLRIADLRGVDVYNVERMWCMFEYCTSLVRVDLSGIDAPQLWDISEMFMDCASLETIDFSQFNAPKLRKANRLFSDCRALRVVDLSNLILNEGQARGAFDGCVSLESFTISESWPLCIERWRETLPKPTAACGKWWSVAEGRWMTLEEIAERGPMADTFTNAPQS